MRPRSAFRVPSRVSVRVLCLESAALLASADPLCSVVSQQRLCLLHHISAQRHLRATKRSCCIRNMSSCPGSEPSRVQLLLRARSLPPKMRKFVEEAIAEAELTPGVHPLEVAAARAVEADPQKRKAMYTAILLGTPVSTPPPTSVRQESFDKSRQGQNRGKRSWEGEERQAAKKTRKDSETYSRSNLGVADLYPMFWGHLLVGDSNLRNLASQELKLNAEYVDDALVIGCCRGGATLREITDLIRRAPLPKYIVMGGLNDVIRVSSG
ncbi:50S ribosomal protein L6 [Frankliniella fusca]|uniref:50S ribosomal protein L6 n=1 Tax=Frankliniella fusca TaxID=407009 RepID=A0AAE1HQD3_9NEOP|nr:50S ribosomal protein L6 [Frankliniella fusca]